MKIKIYILFVTALLSSRGEAQIPGYMGKKLAIMYNIGVSPAISNINYRGNTGFSAFNIRHTLGIDYVRGRQRSIGIAASYMRTAMHYGSYYSFPTTRYEYTIEGTDTSATPYEVYASGNFSGNVYIGSAGLSLYWKFFTKKSLAPLGPYQRIDLGFVKYWVTRNEIEPIKYVLQDHYTDYNTVASYYQERTINIAPPGDENVYSRCQVGWGFGKQRILWNKVVFDRGIRFGALFNLSGDVQLGSENFEDIMARRLFNASCFSFNIGAGFLAY